MVSVSEISNLPSHKTCSPVTRQSLYLSFTLSFEIGYKVQDITYIHCFMLRFDIMLHHIISISLSLFCKPEISFLPLLIQLANVRAG